MRKSLFLAALVLISAGCFAQKNPLVKKAKSEMNAETPNYTAAREAIAEALAQEPTAENYYWAGMIGYREYKGLLEPQWPIQEIDHAKAGAAVKESYQYWLKADELAQVPVLNKKGVEVPTDPKMRGKLAKMMLEYYQAGELLNYGNSFLEKEDYAGAYDALMLHVQMPDLAMMQDPKVQKEMPRDTMYAQYKYYAARFARMADKHAEAAALLEELKDGDYEAININELLYLEYVALQDTAKALATLENAIARFPQEPWFLQNMINHYIFSGQEQMAVDYLAKAIERDPEVADYHKTKGDLDLRLGNYEAALQDYDKALSLDPKLADAVAGKGWVYYTQGVKLNEDASAINDAKEYKKALDAMNVLFRQAMPLFEQAHEMNPQEAEYIKMLKGLYYRFDMDAKYEEMNSKLNNL